MTTSHDMFEPNTAGELAVAGSYGEAPSGYRLPEQTRLGAVHLQVGSLDKSITFYETVLGFRAERNGATATLITADEQVLAVLHERPGARGARQRGQLGLYHFAILLPDRASLGRFVKHLGDIGARAGAGDHLVSEAFYLSDPDGLGIEVYADRPRNTWMRVGRELMMATDPVDVQSLLREAGDTSWTGMPAGTVIGHVHLHVGNLQEASAFFSEGIGFDRMVMRYPGALFLGAGGYHHHLGTNTWAGAGAQPSDDDDARLLEWTIVLPDTAAVDTLADNLARHEFRVERDGDAVVTRDPWGTQVRITAR